MLEFAGICYGLLFVCCCFRLKREFLFSKCQFILARVCGEVSLPVSLARVPSYKNGSRAAVFFFVRSALPSCSEEACLLSGWAALLVRRSHGSCRGRPDGWRSAFLPDFLLLGGRMAVRICFCTISCINWPNSANF